MSQRQRPLISSISISGAPIVALALATVLAVGGCGNDTPSDDTAGFIDLVPFFKTGATTADPTAGLPRNLPPVRGWSTGNRVEYLDFGAVTVPRKFNAAGVAQRIPDTAKVFPMYFFFDASGRPMFSKPAYDTRTATWHMRGGSNPVDPTPVATPAADPARAAYFGVPNLARPRDVLFDDDRASSAFQRPIIDTLLDDPNYTGLWEIVEVTVKDSGYTPDQIKSSASISRAISDGKLSQKRTGKVINCPVVDDRTQITPSPMVNNIPRPRIELWYRRMMGFCYLVNGWETIGETLDETQPATDRSNLRLFKAGVDIDSRLDTFDVLRTSVGTGSGQTLAVAVPVARLYIPTVPIPINNANMDVTRLRYSGDDLSTALPRHTASDPPGYSPIVWLWDLNVRQDPPFSPGTYKDVANIDPAATVARDADTTVNTRNYPISGVATKCVADADCRLGMQCNPMPDVGLATTDPPAGQNLADVVIAREGGPRCDVPVTTFGGYCAPGVARCDVQATVGSDNEKALKALGEAVAGPTYTVHADLATAVTSLSDTTSLSMGTDPKMPMRVVTPAEQATAMAALPGLQTSVNTLTARVAYYDGLGFTKDFGGYGYLCYPMSGGGYCQIRCDVGASATNTQVMATLTVPDGKDPSKSNDVAYTFNTEARCGGTNMLGYRCLPTTVQPDRQRVCLRECKTTDTQNTNRALCDFPINIKPDANGNPSTAYSLGQDLNPKSAVVGEICSITTPPAVSGQTKTVTACTWNPDFEPRDPTVWPGQ